MAAQTDSVQARRAVREPVQIFVRQNNEFRVSWTKWIFCQAFCKFAKSRRPTTGSIEREREMESDNEVNEKTTPRACLRRFLQTRLAINQFKLAELDDMLVVLLEIHNRSVPSSKNLLCSKFLH